MRVLITQEQIRERVETLATEVRQEYANKPLTVVGVLTGSLILLADLIRRVDVPLRIGLVSASSYRGETTTPGELTIDTSLLSDLRGRHVLLIDDILDSGRTLRRLVDFFQDQEVASLKTLVLLRKLGRQVEPLEPDLTGFEIPDLFVVGYGLDYNDEFRYLPYIAELEPGDAQG